MHTIQVRPRLEQHILLVTPQTRQPPAMLPIVLKELVMIMFYYTEFGSLVWTKNPTSAQISQDFCFISNLKDQYTKDILAQI